jgi:tetratricopeptide (TPR) repeat protein
MKLCSIKFIKYTCLAVIVGIASNGNVMSQDLNAAIKLTQSESFEDADALYKQVIAQTPKNGDAYFYAGENTLKNFLSDPLSNSQISAVKEATEYFLSGTKNDSTNALNYIGLGMVTLLEKNDTIAADKYFSKAESFIAKKKKKATEKDITALIKLGVSEVYAKKPRYYKAFGFLNKAKEFNPESTDIYVAMGDVYISQSNASSAIANYNQAVYKNNKLYEPLVKIGYLYMRSRNLNGAKENFEKAKAIDSTYAPVYKYLGEMYSLGGQPKFAIINFKRFLELSGNNVPAQKQYVNALFRAKMYADVLPIVENIMAVDKSSNYLNRVAAYSCYEMKPADYQKGLKYIETFFQNTTPEKIILKDYSYYGRILLKLKDTALVDKAFDKLMTAFNMDTTDIELISDIATNAYYTKRFALSIDMYKRKINIGGKTLNNDYMQLGRAYYQAAQATKNDSLAQVDLFRKAEKAFTDLTVNDPENMQAYVWIANTNAAMDPELKTGLAKPKFELVIQKGLADTIKNVKDLVDAYSYMGSYYMGLQKPDFDSAEPFFNKMLSVDPKNNATKIKAYLNIAVVYTKHPKRKDYVKAREYYKKALVLDPKNEGIQKTIEGMTKTINAINQQQ